MSLRTKPDTQQLDLVIEFRKLRESAGLTQAEAGQVVGGYDAKTVARWENREAKIRACHVDSLRALPINSTNPTSPGRAFTFIDLFAGIGGLRMGFDAIGGQCVFTSEWDKHSQLTYKANFGAHEVHGDIVQIGSERIPDHDVLLAGFPCQPFSLAGVSKKNSLGRPHGFACDTQGTLFFEVERIIEAKQPKVFVLENVKNLVNHDGGRTFATIKHTLATKLGYNVSAKIIDARCVVPQHRERIFIVGFRGDVPHTFDWKGVALPALKQGPKLNSILHPEDGSEIAEAPFTMPNGKVNSKYVLSEHLWEYLQGYAAKHQKLGNGFGFGLVGPDDVSRTLSARYHKDGSEILVRRGNGRPRRLTPRECARLMGFDRPGRVFKLGQVSDTQAYRQFGNAVVVPVVEAIAQALRPHIVAAVETSTQPMQLVRSA